MLDSLRPYTDATEILVVGAGLAGFAAALSFSQAGFETMLVGAPEALANGRTVALLDGSMRFLDELGLRPEIERRGAPMRALRIVDDARGLWRAPTVEFHAGEINLDAFGWNIENVELIAALSEEAARRTPLKIIAGRVEAYDWSSEKARAKCADGRMVAARLIVAADGRSSPARVSADIGTRVHRSAQTALTTILAHARPHHDFSTEFHTRQGPFTLVPLPPAADDRHRSSLVWVMSEAEARRRSALPDGALAAEIETQAQSIHGAMRISGPRGVFPLASQSATRLTAARLALIGDAAHVLPPIGAQGFNLGLRDVAQLVEIARRAKEAGEDFGGAGALARYGAARRGDVFARAAAVNALNRSLVADFGPIDLARSVGLTALGAIGPLRRFVMREGIAPRRPWPGATRP
jgi:2-octaprenyl-6-methoxyphenol hydroxylase